MTIIDRIIKSDQVLMNDRIILDASCRRFQAHKIYLRAAAARRWAINRASAQGQKPSERESRLKSVDDLLRNVGFPSSLLFHLRVPSTLGARTKTHGWQ
jgi:hypothetical protein